MPISCSIIKHISKKSCRFYSLIQKNDVSKVNYHNIGKEIKKLEKLMKSSAKDLDFEQAAKYRDLIKELKDKVLINKA